MIDGIGKMTKDHHLELVEGEAHIWKVYCSCGYQRSAAFGEEHAAKIAARHLGRMGYAPSPRGSLYQ